MKRHVEHLSVLKVMDPLFHTKQHHRIQVACLFYYSTHLLQLHQTSVLPSKYRHFQGWAYLAEKL